MSVKVNLLPSEVRQRSEAARRNAAIGVAFAVLAAGVGVVYVTQLQRVDNAQSAVDDEQARLEALQADLADLGEFAQLRDLRAQGDRLLQAALGGEVSIAGILQDIASVMPSDAQLESLTVTVSEPAPGELGDLRDTYGTVAMTGMTRLGHAPGLERFLIEMDKIGAFSDLYFSNSTVDERGVSEFSAQLDLGPEVLTRRYADGLPEELR